METGFWLRLNGIDVTVLWHCLAPERLGTRLADDSYVGRFRIAPGAFGSTEETDGIEIATGDFGPAFADGIMIAQDGKNAPTAQNFKLVRWGQIKAALGL